MPIDETKKLLNQSIKFLYDEHVEILLYIPEKYLQEISPNKRFHFAEILKSFNKDTFDELIRYGEKLRKETLRVIKELNLEISETEKDEIIKIINKYCDSSLYIKRFQIFINSTERKFQHYGMPFNLENYRIDLPQSLCEVGSKNNTRKIISKIINEIEIVQFNKNTQKISDRSIFNKANTIYNNHQFSFWLIAIIISIALGIIAL